MPTIKLDNITVKYWYVLELALMTEQTWLINGSPLGGINTYVFGSSGSAEKSGSSVLILMVACLILNTYEYILCYLSRCPFLGALLNEDIVMVVVWILIRPDETPTEVIQSYISI